MGEVSGWVVIKGSETGAREPGRHATDLRARCQARWNQS